MNVNGYFIDPPARPRDYPTHVQWSGENRLFSAPECDALIALGEELGFVDATIGSPQDQRLDREYRCVEVAMLPYGVKTAWLYDRVSKRVQWANADLWGFDLIGLREPFQLLRYRAPGVEGGPAGKYEWHQDFGAGYMSNRKLSVVSQLSAPDDYEDCRLQLQTHLLETMNYLERGDGVAFPTWTPHRVTPITRGVRYAMVAWVHGPAFR